MKGVSCPRCIRGGQIKGHRRRCFQYLSILYMLLTLLGAPDISERRASLPEPPRKTLRYLKVLLS